jgi:hypothetical protein
MARSLVEKYLMITKDGFVPVSKTLELKMAKNGINPVFQALISVLPLLLLDLKMDPPSSQGHTCGPPTSRPVLAD